GYTNQFLVKSRNSFAILYSDLSVNENHHAAHVFEKTLGSSCDIFAALTTDEYDEMRKIVIRLIMSTDMAKHFEYLTKFKAKLAIPTFGRLDTPDNRLSVMEMAIKCGDLNNPTKSPALAAKWVDCIMEEFFRQGDRERELGLPISQFMDRTCPDVPKCQVGFIDILVAPLFDAWTTFAHEDLRTVELQQTIRRNRARWTTMATTALVPVPQGTVPILPREPASLRSSDVDPIRRTSADGDVIGTAAPPASGSRRVSKHGSHHALKNLPISIDSSLVVRHRHSTSTSLLQLRAVQDEQPSVEPAPAELGVARKANSAMHLPALREADAA
ncbi:hypothetical protein HK405_000880, partial [Cladochytrium tenue]